MKKSKLFTGVMSTACAAAILVTGTLALTGSGMTPDNDFTSKLGPVPPPTIVDEFDKDNGPEHNKDIYVTNPKEEGAQTVYVRVQLQEYLDLDTSVKPDPLNASKWETHIPSGTPATDTSGNKYHGMFTWGMGDVHLGLDISRPESDGYWIYDTADGWAYWSQPLEPGESTDKILDAVTELKDGAVNYYYAIRGEMEWVTAEDLVQWTGEGEGTRNQKPTEENSFVGMSLAEIKSGAIKDYFKAYTGGTVTAPTSITLSGQASEVTVGATAPVPTVNATPEGASTAVTWLSSDPRVATVDPATGVVTGVAPGKVTITATSTEDTSKKATYEISVVDVPVVTYTYTVNPGKTSWEIGDDPTAGTTISYKGSDGSTGTISAGITAHPAQLVADTTSVTLQFTGPDGKEANTVMNITVSDPTSGLVQDAAGNYFKNVAGYKNLYQEMGTDGKTPGELVYAGDGNLEDKHQVYTIGKNGTNPWTLLKTSVLGTDKVTTATYYVNNGGAFVSLYPDAGVAGEYEAGGLDYGRAFICTRGGVDDIGATDYCKKCSIVKEYQFK